jgi:sirohydrochlorin cobaltochelatase
LAAWLEAGERRIGEVAITGEYELRHYLDADAEGLDTHTTPAAARAIALNDAAGNYRPLKTAPNLRRGWRLILANIGEVHEALDGFYPAMLAERLAFECGRLGVTPLRETLGRQSGMYAITKKITDTQADAMIGAFCRCEGGEPGCLKKVLWQIAPGVPITSLPAEKFEPAERAAIPMLCAEACNLLVARAREVVKQQPPNAPPSQPQ